MKIWRNGKPEDVEFGEFHNRLVRWFDTFLTDVQLQWSKVEVEPPRIERLIWDADPTQKVRFTLVSMTENSDDFLITYRIEFPDGNEMFGRFIGLQWEELPKRVESTLAPVVRHFRGNPREP